MDGFYSIIYFKTTSLTDEMISIGILVGGGEGPFIYISKSRLKLLKSLLDKEVFKLLNRSLIGFSKKVEEFRLNNGKSLLFDPVFSVEELKYISAKTNRMITYGQPTSINKWVDEDFFEKLISSFLLEKVHKNTSKTVDFRTDWEKYYNQLPDKWIAINVPIKELVKGTSLVLNLDVIDKKRKTIVNGYDFDLGEKEFNHTSFQIDLILATLPQYKLTIVHPHPRRESGKRNLKELKKKLKEVQFMSFSEFMKINVDK